MIEAGHVDFSQTVASVMGKAPRTVDPDDLAITAADLLRERMVDQVPVVDAHGRPVGLLDVQDLLAARLLG
jgi:arabinose-5-phosphate isomerase